MRNERGEGRLGFIVALLILAVGVYLGIKLIPVKVALFALSDKIEQKIQRASWRTFEQAKAETLEFIKREAAATGYPTDTLKISMPAPVTNELVVIVNWEIPVDLAVTQYKWHYHVEKRAPLLGRGGPSF